MGRSDESVHALNMMFLEWVGKFWKKKTLLVEIIVEKRKANRNKLQNEFN